MKTKLRHLHAQTLPNQSLSVPCFGELGQSYASNIGLSSPLSIIKVLLLAIQIVCKFIFYGISFIGIFLSFFNFDLRFESTIKDFGYWLFSISLRSMSKSLFQTWLICGLPKIFWGPCCKILMINNLIYEHNYDKITIN